MLIKNMDAFPKALSELMAGRRMEQLDLAVRADISQAAISYYLSGRRVPQLRTIEKIAAALEVEPEYFELYRRTKAKHLVDQAMTDGLIDLEDIELILAGKRFAGKTPKTG